MEEPSPNDPQQMKAYMDYDFDSDHKFQSYLDGIFPQPKGLLLKKFQRKFFKKNVDPEFPIEFDNISKKVAIYLLLFPSRCFLCFQ